MRVLFVVVTVFVSGLACEPEIGGLCDPDAANVAAHVTVKKGTNNLVQDVSLDNCSEGFCLSTDGSRPYCTKRCEADSECSEAGAGFQCQPEDPQNLQQWIVSPFDPLGCSDFEDTAKPREGAQSTSAPCTADTDCTTAGESCLGADGTDKICAIPGRGCLTGPDGSLSTHPFRYCSTTPDVIKARDKQYGR